MKIPCEVCGTDIAFLSWKTFFSFKSNAVNCTCCGANYRLNFWFSLLAGLFGGGFTLILVQIKDALSETDFLIWGIGVGSVLYLFLYFLSFALVARVIKHPLVLEREKEPYSGYCYSSSFAGRVGSGNLGFISSKRFIWVPVLAVFLPIASLMVYVLFFY